MARLHLDIQALRSRIGSLRDQFPEVFEGDDDQFLADVLEGESSFHEVMGKLVRHRSYDRALADGVKSAIADLAERRKRFETRAEKASDLMAMLMAEAGVKSLVLPDGTVSLRDGVPKVTITDETAIPKDYQKITVAPDKTAIKEALKAGKAVPGAELSNGAQTISVRTK